MRLIDCFIGLMSYTGFAMGGSAKRPVSFEQFKKEVDQLLEQSRAMAEQGGFSPEDYDLARFAVCAWVDESVLCSTWEGKEKWEHQQLQRIHYHTTNAGEEFFQRLEQMDPDNRGLLEVYGHCLALGLAGRYYAVKSRPELEQASQEVIEAVIKDSTDPFLSEETKFFTDSYLAESERPKKKIQWGVVPRTILLLSASVGASFLLWWVMNSYLTALVETYFSTGK